MATTEISKGSFADVIASATRGAINDDATEAYKALVAEMMQIQRLRGAASKGKVTLELSLELNAKGTFEITSDVRVKHPPMIKTRAFMYPQRDGTLSEQDERQMKLGLDEAKDVSTATTSKVRDISDRRMAAANDTD